MGELIAFLLLLTALVMLAAYVASGSEQVDRCLEPLLEEKVEDFLDQTPPGGLPTAGTGKKGLPVVAPPSGR